VQILDSGAGISLEQQQQLFQPILSGKATRKMNGERSIGLGLVIARKIVEAHGGRMFVESEPGHGSTFGFSLPASRLGQNPVSVTDMPAWSEQALQARGGKRDQRSVD
jgi:signal transduction histidine kinase